MPERKYRHRGYQDTDRPVERSTEYQGPSLPPRERPEGPRGRGLGAPTDTVFRCKVCGNKVQFTGVMALDMTCAGCGNDLHTCSNCISFDTSRPNECRKPVLQRVVSKTKRNPCELFTPNAVQEFASDMRAATTSPRAAFDALFKKK